jgi:hypothetical protein
VNITSKDFEQDLKGAIAAAQKPRTNDEGPMPANKLSAVPRDTEIDGAANLDQLRRMTSRLMSALLLGTVMSKEGSAKLGRIDKRMNALEREIGRGLNNVA